MNPASRQIGTQTRRASWTLIRKLAARRPASAVRWGAIKVMRVKAEEALAPYKGRYEHLCILWERRLRPLCGSMQRLEWAEFRPLRLAREEHWSDWLAWLLQTS